MSSRIWIWILASRVSTLSGLSTLFLAALLCMGCGVSGAEQAHLDAMAAEHAEDKPVASAAATAEIEVPILEREVRYATLDGTPITGFLARPPEGSVPTPAGILVIHEWWGLNDNIRAMARQLAAAGYSALAVDLYGGEVAESPARARELMQASLTNGAALRDNLRQAHRYLEADLHAARTAAIGWCFGGGWSLQAALLLPGQLDAAVIYYGRVVSDKTSLASLDTPLLGHFGALDRGIPLESVKAFESALSDLGKDAQVHVYEGAGHAFANPSGTRYNAAAAEEAWTRTLSFLERTLGTRGR